MSEISVLVEGGKASAGAPLGPALGPLGVNIGQVVSTINEKTKGFSGMKVPVKVIVDSKDKSFEVKVGSPPTSALIKKEAGIPKASGNSKEKSGDLTLEQVKKLAEMKIDNLTSSKIEAAVKEVLGTCNSMGVFVNGLRAVEIIAKIESGELKV